MPQPAKRYLTAKEVAEIFVVSEETVRRQCAKGAIPGAVKFGSQWRIPRAYVERLEHFPNDEDEDEKERS